MASNNAWIGAWNAKAAGQRQMLSERLARKPANPYLESLRTQYLRRAQNAVSFKQSAVQAYAEHLRATSQIIAGAIPGGAASSKGKGSLGG
jgi:hypothetical protein